MWVIKGWAVRDTEQVLFSLFGCRSNTHPSVWISLTVSVQVWRTKDGKCLSMPKEMTACVRDEFLTNLFITGDCHLFSICILRAVEGKQNKTTDLSATHLRQKRAPSKKKGQSNFYQMSVMGRKFWKIVQSGHDLMCIWWELQREKQWRTGGWVKLSYRGEESFWRRRGEGEGLRECECRRRLPTSPFFTFDLLGLSSSEEDEEPESANVEESLSGKWSWWHCSLTG